MVLDFDGLGVDGVINELENARFANDCISPKVMSAKERDIGEWDDEHPLNQRDYCAAEMKRLFA